MNVPNSHPVIEVKNVSFSYGATPVLEDINFTIQPTQYVGLIGPNGGGKTTLLKLILGLLSPQQGQIFVSGEPVQNLKNRSAIGYVAQKASLVEAAFPATVQEIVQSGRTPGLGFLKRFTPSDRDAVERAIETTGIAGYRNRLIGRLSGGEKQKVFIARALAASPSILILDEPTVGVDVASEEAFYQFLDKLHCEMGLTILFVTHDIDVIAQEVESVLCLNRTLVCHTSTQDFLKSNVLETLYGKKVKFVRHQD